MQSDPIRTRVRIEPIGFGRNVSDSDRIGSDRLLAPESDPIRYCVYFSNDASCGYLFDAQATIFCQVGGYLRGESQTILLSISALAGRAVTGHTQWKSWSKYPPIWDTSVHRRTMSVLRNRNYAGSIDICLIIIRGWLISMKLKTGHLCKIGMIWWKNTLKYQESVDWKVNFIRNNEVLSLRESIFSRIQNDTISILYIELKLLEILYFDKVCRLYFYGMASDRIGLRRCVSKLWPSW